MRPAKTYRAPDDKERAALVALAEALRGLDPDADADAVQNTVFEIGKSHGFDNLRAWFGCLYEVLLGQTEGPRFGIFAQALRARGDRRPDRHRAAAGASPPPHEQ